jgi:hypothetical protein
LAVFHLDPILVAAFGGQPIYAYFYANFYIYGKQKTLKYDDKSGRQG